VAGEASQQDVGAKDVQGRDESPQGESIAGQQE